MLGIDMGNGEGDGGVPDQSVRVGDLVGATGGMAGMEGMDMGSMFRFLPMMFGKQGDPIVRQDLARLYTVMEKLLEEVSFEAGKAGLEKVLVDTAYVNDKLGEVAADEDLSRYVL